jgi:polyisoprenoid-binding protein YceI
MTLRRILAGVAALLVVAVVVGFVIARQIIFGHTPHPRAAHSSPLTATPCAAIASGSSLHAFAISSQQSLVSYHAHFTAFGDPLPGDVVGESHDVSGEFLITSSPSPTITALNVLIDMRTFDSGEPTRDEHLREQTFETDKYPYATFTATNSQVLSAPYGDGQSVTFKLPGSMTIHGVSRPITLDVTGRFANAAITGNAETDFRLQDFGMHPPQAVPGVTISNAVSVTVQFVAPAEQCTHLNLSPAAS